MKIKPNTSAACFRCGQRYTRRVQREGILERCISLACIYPLRCQVCDRRFVFLQWGVRYGKRPADRRQYQRVEVNGTVALSSGCEEGQGVVRDVALGGCRIETDLSLRPDQLLTLSLQLPGEVPPVCVTAARIRSSQGRVVGLQFLELPPEDKKRLGGFVQARLSGGEATRQARRTGQSPSGWEGLIRLWE